MASSSSVTAGVNATAAQYNNLREDVVLGRLVQGTDTYGATTTIDWSDTTRGKVRTVTMTGNITTLAFSNPVAGQVIVLRLIQDATGSRTVDTWPTTIKWPSGVAPVLSTGANKIDSFTFICISTGPSVFDALFNGFGLS